MTSPEEEELPPHRGRRRGGPPRRREYAGGYRHVVTRPPSRSPAARGAGGFSFLPPLAGVGYVGWWWCGGGRLAGRGEEAMRVTALSWTHVVSVSLTSMWAPRRVGARVTSYARPLIFWQRFVWVRFTAILFRLFFEFVWRG